MTTKRRLGPIDDTTDDDSESFVSASLPLQDKMRVQHPHFPYAYSIEAERFANLVYSYTSSLFTWPDIDSDAPRNARGSLQDKRDYLSKLDEHLFTYCIELAVLRSALKKAEHDFEEMKGRYREKWHELLDESEHQEPAKCRSRCFPLEIVTRICGYMYPEIRRCDVFFAKEMADSEPWGDLLYKVLPYSVSVSDLQKSGGNLATWTKLTNLLIRFWPQRIKKSNNKRFIGNNHWILQRRLHVKIETEDDSTGREYAIGVLVGYKDVSRVMEKLVSLHDDCWGCTGDVVAPRCKEARVPMHYLPCIGPMFPCLQTLSLGDVDLPTLETPEPIRTFPYYFRSLDTTHLETLSLRSNQIPNQEYAERFFTASPTISFPNLKNLEFGITKLDGQFVALALDCLVSSETRLRTLGLYELFWPGSCDSEHHTLESLRDMVTRISPKCQYVQKLSFFACTNRTLKEDDRAGRRDMDHQDKMVATLLDQLATPSEIDGHSTVMFPELRHLAIPYTSKRGYAFELIEFLISRENLHHSIDTLEMSLSVSLPNLLGEQGELESEAREFYERLELGLYVHDLVFNESVPPDWR